MSIPAVKPGLLGRLYYSTKETTPGTLVVPTISFAPIKHSLIWQEKHALSKQITGIDGPASHIRECLFAGGSVSDYAEPAHFGFVLHHALNSAASSALVNSSIIAYKHSWNVAPVYPPSTFTLIKQNASIIKEEWGGNGIESWSLKGGTSACMLDYKISAMGSNYNDAATEPVVSVLSDAANVPFPAILSNLLIDGVAVPAGQFMADWSISYSAGQAVNTNTAGSTDGSATRFSKKARQSLKATFKLIVLDNTYPADFLAAGNHTYEFQLIGPLIDNTTTPKTYAMIGVKFMSARIVNKIATELGEEGDYYIPIEIEGVVDSVSGFLGEYYTIDLTATA